MEGISFQCQKEDTTCLKPLPPNFTQRVGKGGPGVDIVSRETDFYSEQLEKNIWEISLGI